MEIKWDNWQKKILEHKGNLVIRAGRQSGKSEVISQKAVSFALENPDTVTMIIAASQRQSGLLFEKVRGKLDELLTPYPDKPTLTRIILPNGSRIYSLPAGRTAYSIRGYTIDLLIADEAAYIPQTVWLAVTPMMAVSKITKGFGWTILISTPFGKGGYFYDCCHDSDFLHMHISSENCPRISPDFLAKERKRMSKQQYAQEYLAEFIDEYRQFFSTELLKSRMTFMEWGFSSDFDKSAKYYLGVDVARYGGDENSFVVSEMKGRKVRIVKVLTSQRVSTVDAIGQIIRLNTKFNFRKIFIDDSGVGGGVTDILIERLGRKVMGLNNASRRIQVQGDDKNRGILKEDLYSNVLTLLEMGSLDLINDLDMMRSLKSIVFEYNDSGKVKIYGSYSHIAEGLVRACWCVKEKGLDMFVY